MRLAGTYGIGSGGTLTQACMTDLVWYSWYEEFMTPFVRLPICCNQDEDCDLMDKCRSNKKSLRPFE